MSTNLNKIREALAIQTQKNHEIFNYAIPDTWLAFDYKVPKSRSTMAMCLSIRIISIKV